MFDIFIELQRLSLLKKFKIKYIFLIIRKLIEKKSAKQSEQYSQDAKREKKTFVVWQASLYSFDCINKEIQPTISRSSE